MNQAAQNVDTVLAQTLLGMNVTDQRALDLAMIEADAPRIKAAWGPTPYLGLSLAAAKAAAEPAGLPLFRYLGGPGAHMLPVPAPIS